MQIQSIIITKRLVCRLGKIAGDCGFLFPSGCLGSTEVRWRFLAHDTNRALVFLKKISNVQR